MGISGSRSGATVASAWISMMRLGVKGYTKNANNVRNGNHILI
jgi:glutamate/tyrosine decarboxylase-like PLP-dependent enzyme